MYSEYEDIKRKKVKKEMDRKIEDEKRYSFMPDRVTKYKDADFGFEPASPNSTQRKEVYEKLYRDAEVQNSRRESRQRAKQRELQEMSRFSSLTYKHSGKKHPSLMYFRKLGPK